MSARMMKKLAGAPLELVEVEAEEQLSDDDEDDDSEEKRNFGKGKHLNPFDLLNQQSFSESESEIKEDDNETEHASAAAKLPNSSITKKKKKKRKKKNSKHVGNHISSEDNELTDRYIKDIDPLIGKVREVVPYQSQKISNAVADKTLMSVELKHLNPQNEMRRTFGKRVVKLETKRGRQKLTLKSTYMVTAKESWPPLTKNIIAMRTVAEPEQLSGASTANKQLYGNEPQWFAFEHSPYYQSTQNLFLTALERTDSDFLINLMRRCPYHVDSLIQLSELCKMTEDYSLASELIERAVLVLESSLHLSFNLTSGNCRLDYRRQENRAFYIVLFKHAQYLEARACCRTAFELSKLILSFNPVEDPLAMILIIDYYAMRSKQYSWLVKFYEKYDTIRNLSQLPNMAYSYALALHTLYGECEQANQALQYALLMFPGVLRPLLDEMSVQTDQRVIAASYFNSDVSGSQSPALHQLVCLYICRAKVIWRQGNILGWLETNVNAVLDRIASKDDIIADFNQKRAARYVSPPRPILRHVILSDYKEKVPLANFVAKEKQPIMAYDPLPPLDSIDYFARKSSSSSPTTANNRSVSMFFQSLLPSFNVNNVAANNEPRAAVAAAAAENVNAPAVGLEDHAAVEDEAAQIDRQLTELNMNLENAAVEGAAGSEASSYRELSQSLTHMVDAMRDFLQNFRISEHMPASANISSSDEDSSDYFD